MKRPGMTFPRQLKGVGETLIIMARSYFSGGMTPIEKSMNNVFT